MRMAGQWEAARRATVCAGEGDALECGTALSGSTGEEQKPRAAVLMCVHNNRKYPLPVVTTSDRGYIFP